MSNNKNKPKLMFAQLELANRNMKLEISAHKQIARSLKDREDRFKTIFYHAPVPYFLIDLDGNFINGNLASYQLTGYKKEELFGKNFIEINLIDKKDQKAISGLILRSATGECTGPDEFIMKKKDGSFTNIEILTSPVTISDKKHILGVAHDVTERDMAQNKLKESEEKFRKLFNSAHDALMTMSPPSWKFTSGNPAILDMFKVKNIEEFLTYGPWDISPEKQSDGRLSSEKAREMIEKAMKEGSNFFDWTHKRINGESFPATVLLTRIKLKDETFLQATVRDITEQKRAEEIKNVLIDIANSVNYTHDLGDFYQVIHKLLSRIIDVTNFYIAIVDIKKCSLDFPYHVDTKDDDFSSITNFNTDDSLTGLVTSKREPILLKTEELKQINSRKGVWGPTPVIWMGVPLIVKNEVIGVMATQSYNNPNLYDIQDLNILSAVSDQVAIAIDRKRAEEELQESEEKYKTLVENATDGITIIQDEKVVFVNKYLAEMYGETAEKIIGKPFAIFIHNDSRGSIIERYKLRISGKKIPNKYRVALCNKKKEKVFCDLNVSITSYNGKPAEQIIVHDISEDILKEKQLQISEKKYRDLFEKSDDAVLIIQNGKFVDCNQATIKMLRYKTKKEFLNTHPSELSPETQPDGKLSFEKANEMMEIAFKNGSNRFQWDHKRANGEVFPVEVLLTAISTDKKNKIIHTVWRDITDRKKIENDIHKSIMQRSKLLNIARELGASLDFQYILHKITVRMLDLLQSQGSTIYLLDENKKFLTPVVTNDMPYEQNVMSEKIEVNSSLTGKVVKDKKGMVFNNASQNPDAYQIPGTSEDDDEHLMVLPLLKENIIYGTLNLYRKGKIYAKADFELAETFALHASTAIQNSLIHQDLIHAINVQKQTENDLRQSEERFKRLFNDLGDAVYVTKLGGANRGKILEVNRAAVKQTGYTREELLKMNIIKDLYISGSGDIKADDWETKLGKGEIISTSEKKRRKDGTEFWTEVIVSSIQFKGKNAGLSMNHDITDRKKAENQIKKNESLLISILESTGDGLLVVNNKGQVTHRNNEFNKMWRIPSNLIDSKDDNKLIDFVLSQLTNPSQFTSKVQELYNTTKSDLDIIHFKDGQIFERYTQSLMDENTIAGRVWSFRDITDRKQNEDALLESEVKYRTLTENIPIGIYRNTPGVKGKFLEANKAMIDMFGFKDRRSMLKAPASSLYISPHTRKLFSDKLMEKGSVKNEELRLLRKDGNTFIGSVTAIAVKDKDGRVIHYDGLIEDITKEAELRVKLQDNEEKFRSIVQNSPCIIMQADRHGVISFINYQYSGLEPENIIGKAIYDLMQPEYHDAAKNTIKKVFDTGDSYSFESLGLATDENALWYKNTVSAIRKIDKVVGIAILAADISELKQTDIMKTEFISSVSHELRTPLTIIRESLSLLSDGLFGELNKEQAEIVNPAMEDVDRLGRIINNLLDISKIDGHKIKIEQEMIDIVELAKGVIKSFGNQIASKNIKLILTANQDSINLYLDHDRIIQVFMNLIGNSIKFTKEGKIEVFITEKEKIVECCIADTGRGIDTKDLGTLFDRFHQVGKVVKAGEKGSGLGLSISKGIVKLHKGKIWVNSIIDKGTKFYFSLPKYSPDEIILDNIEKEINAASKKRIKLSLLLVKVDNIAEIEKKYSSEGANKIIKGILKALQDTLAPGEFSFINSRNEIVLFSYITAQNTSIIVSKLEDMLEKLSAKIGMKTAVELSYGYSIYPNDADGASTLIEAANKNLKKQ